MKLGDNLQKIFNSFDFMGNRIKRLRVDTPSEKPDYRDSDYDTKKDFVANKEYVDKVTTYDTELAKKYKNPFKQWWMKNVHGLPYKELFDALFFPRLAPEYIDPKVLKCSITVYDSPLIKANNIVNYANEVLYNSDSKSIKYIIFAGQTVNLKIALKINPGDRISGVTGKISIQKPDGTQVFGFNSTTTTDNYSVINCSFVYGRGMKIYFLKQFNECPVKEDSYGEESPVENPSFELKYDLTEQFETECLIIDSFLTHKRDDENGPSENVEEYLISNKCIFNSSEEGIFDIAIPEKILLSENNIYFDMVNQEDKCIFGSGKLNKHNLLNQKTISKDGINYITGSYNFGNTEYNTEIYLYPELFRLVNN